MEVKNIISIFLAVGGGSIALAGFFTAHTTWINLGIAGMFLSAVVFAVKPSAYVKKETVDTIFRSYKKFSNFLSGNLNLEGKAVFIPPFENLPEGGVFVPLRKKFRLDVARLDEKTVFLTNVPREDEMGMFLGPFGAELVKKYEEHLEGTLEGVGVEGVESVAGSVLKSLGLAERVYIEDMDNEITVFLKPSFECSPNECKRFPCPVCSSLLLALAKGTKQILTIEDMKQTEKGIIVKIKKLGGLEEWM